MKQLRLADHYFFRTAFKPTDLPPALRDLSRATRRPIRVQVLLSESNIAKQFQALPRVGQFSVETLIAQRDLAAGVLSHPVGRGQGRTVSGRFYAVRHPTFPGAWLIITCDSSDFGGAVLGRAVKSLRPRATKPLLRTSQIQEVLTTVSVVHGVSGPPRQAEPSGFAPHPRIYQVGSRTRIQSPFAGKAIEADRRWTDVSIPEAFREARESESWVTDATMAYWWNRQPLRIKVTRRGQLVFDSTPTEIFWNAVDAVTTMGLERFRFLDGRDRTRERGFVSRPFAIEFARPLFVSHEALARFHGAIARITHSNCTVLHGNPYFHAALLDYTDGSTYEVVVLDPSRITVIPQGRASARALQRFCVSVFSQIREGDFREVDL